MFLLSMTLTQRPTGPPNAISHNELPRLPLNMRTERIMADMISRSVICDTRERADGKSNTVKNKQKET